jgi:NADP-dependent 3-hydroxy acid dehydrogenase YdfG
MDKKVIAISGGSDGLGRTIAEELVFDNIIVILSNNEEKVLSVSKEIGCEGLFCDVTDFYSCEKAFNKIKEKYGRIDCVINCAGVWIEGELDSNNVIKIKQAVDVNITGTMNFTKAVVSKLKEQKNGIIFLINSQAGFYSKEGRTIYNSTKWALTGFGRSLQLELEKYGIRVMSIHPGKMNTSFFEKTGIKKDLSDALDPKEVARIIKFILTLNETTSIPEIGVKFVKK